MNRPGVRTYGHGHVTAFSDTLTNVKRNSFVYFELILTFALNRNARYSNTHY